jgi:hypothetical protein
LMKRAVANCAAGNYRDCFYFHGEDYRSTIKQL